jgi:hypothetical protein
LCNLVRIEPRVHEKRARIVEAVSARHLDARVDKPCGFKKIDELLVAERTRHATYPELHALLHVLWKLALNDDIRNSKPTTWFQHAKRFGNHLSLVARQVDHAVGDDHIHRIARQRNFLDSSTQEFDVGNSRFGSIITRKLQHVIGHVETVRFPGWSNTTRREDDVDAAAGSEIENDFSGIESGERCWIPAAERCEYCRVGEKVGLAFDVEIGRDWIDRSIEGSGAAARADRSAT